MNGIMIIIIALLSIGTGCINLMRRHSSMLDEWRETDAQDSYQRFRGKSFIILGIPLGIYGLSSVILKLQLTSGQNALVILICCLPALIYGVVGEWHYRKH